MTEKGIAGAPAVVVSFTRLGTDHEVPDLVLDGPLRPESLQASIHGFVSERLNTSEFTVQLREAAGFIDVGTHSAGTFTISAPD